MKIPPPIHYPSSRFYFSGLALATLAFLLLSGPVRATSNTWTDASSGSWNSAASWAGGVNIPGSTSSTTSTDTATFNTAAGVAITIDANRNLENITFDANTGSFALSGGNLLLTSSGTVQLASTVTSTGQTETIDTPITLEGNYTFANNAATTDLLNFGAAGTITSSATTGTTTLTLAGTNTGANIVNGVISNGGGTNLVGVTKSGAGTWILAGANTFGGPVTISAGVLQLNNATASGTGAVTVGVSNGLAFGTGIGTFTVGSIAGSGALVLADTGGNAVTLQAGGNNTNTTYSGILSGIGGLTKNGTGTLTLSGSNNYSGTTTVNSGIVLAGTNSTYGALVVASGATFEQNPSSGLGAGYSTTIGTLSGSGTLLYENGAISIGTFIINETANSTFSGSMGAGNTANGDFVFLTKTGTGTLIFNGATGALTLQRGMTITAGGFTLSGSATLALVAGKGNTGRNIFTVDQGASLTLDNSTTNVNSRLGNALDDSITFNGGMFNLIGSGTTATTETIKAHVTGTSNVATGLVFGAGSDVINITAGSGQTAVLTISAGSQARAAGSTVLYEGTNLGTATSASATPNVANLMLGGAAVPNNSATAAPGSGITLGVLPGEFVDAIISGTDTYGIATYDTVKGVRSLVAGTENTGALTLNANVDANSTLSTSAATTINSLQLDTGGSINTASGSLTDASGSILTTGASVNITGANALISGTGPGGSAELAIYNAPSGTLTIAATISGTVGLTKGGGGTTILTANNASSLSGAITINGGILSIAADTALGASTNSVAINTGGTLQSTGASVSSARNITLGGTIATTVSNGDIDISGASSNVLALTGTVGGVGSLNKSGIGTLVLSNANNYTGVTNIQNGTVSINAVTTGTAVQALGEGNAVNLGVASTSSGTLQYTGAGGTLDKNINALGNGGDTISNTGSGILTLSGMLAKANTVLTLSSGTFIVSGQITGGSSATFNSDFDISNATVTVSATNNNYVGPTAIYAGGTLLNGADNALPTGTVLTTGSSTDGAVTNTYSLNGFDQSIAALNSVSSGSNNNLVQNGATGSGTNTLTLTGLASGTIGGSTAVNGNFGGSVRNGNSAALALTVAGGVQTLSGSNSYTGATQVINGTLNLTGQLGNTNVTVGNASTGSLAPALTGGIGNNGTSGSLFAPSNSPSYKVYTPSNSIGNIAGNVTISGTSAGGSPGSLFATKENVTTLQVGSLTLNAGAVLNWQFNSTANSNSFVAVNGTLILPSSGVVDINLLNEGTGSAWTSTPGTYDLFSYGSLTASQGVANSFMITSGSTSGDTYTFGTSGTFVTLTIAASANTSQLGITPSPVNLGSVFVNTAVTSTGTLTNNAGSGSADWTTSTTGNATVSPTGGTGLASGSSTLLTVGINGSYGTSGSGQTVGTVTANNVSNPSGSGTANVTADVYDPASLTASVSGTGTATNTLTLANAADSGLRAGVSVSASTSGIDPNFTYTAGATSVGNVTSANPSGVTATVGTVSANSNLLNGTYSTNGTVTGTITYTDPALQTQAVAAGDPVLGATQSWNISATKTVTGATSSGSSNPATAYITAGRSYNLSGAFNSGTANPILSSAVAGGHGTNAYILGGTATVAANVSAYFTAAGVKDPANPFQSSDTFTLNGINSSGVSQSGSHDGSIITDPFVLQLSYVTNVNVSDGQYYIGWYDGALTAPGFVNAIAGNSNGGSQYYNAGTITTGTWTLGEEFEGSYAAFLAANPTLTALDDQLGAYGFDPSTGLAWAVVDHNSDFAVIPEPQTWGMILGGFGVLACIRRLRKHRVGT